MCGQMAKRTEQPTGNFATRVEYMPLASLKPHPRNPKAHDLPALMTLIEKHGFTEPILMDEGSGYVVAGHGRIDALKEMRNQQFALPDRLQVDAGGDWLVPVVRGVKFPSARAVEAYLIASNQATIMGGWQEQALTSLLSDLATSEPDWEALTAITQLELDQLLLDLEYESVGGNMATGFTTKSRAVTAAVVILLQDARLFEEAIRATGERERGKALIEVCKAYLEARQQAL